MKAEARETALNRRESLSEEECLRRSKLVIERLKGQQEFRDAKTVMAYVSFRREVHTHELIRELLASGKKRVVVPLANYTRREIYPREINDFERDLAEGALGILEPKTETADVPLNKLNLVIAPGVAFDTCGNRLGYGGGFYDKFLASLPKGTPVIALAFELQIIEETHCEPHDCLVGKVITEKRVIECKAGGL